MSQTAIDVYLAECNALRNDNLARFEFQRQTFNYIVVLVSAGLAFAATWHPIAGVNPAKYLVLVPFVAAPLSYMYFDNEMIIWANGKYLDTVLYKRIDDILGRDALGMEERMKWHFTRGQNALHLLLSTGRWLLFFLPLIGPTLYGFFSVKTRFDSLNIGFEMPVWLILLVDSLLTLLTAFAAAGVIAMRTNVWGKPWQKNILAIASQPDSNQVEDSSSVDAEDVSQPG